MKKLAILYRVIQDWRHPVFEDLNKEYVLTVYHGPDFENSKVRSTKRTKKYNSLQLFSLNFRYKSNKGTAYMPFSPFLFLRLTRDRPDIILCEGASNIANDISGFLYSKIFNKPFIWWTLGELQDGSKKTRIRKLLNPIIRFIENKSTAILVYSSVGKKYYLDNGFDESKIFTAVNFVPKKQLPKNNFRKNTSKTLNICYVGALESNKKVDILLNVQKIVEESGLSINLNIIGEGSEGDNLKKLSKTLRLNKTTFHGRLLDDELSQQLLKNQLLIMPGLGGLVISEALIHHLPVICSVGDGCEVDLLSSGNGIILDEMNEINLYNEIKHLYNNRTELEKMKENCKNALTLYNYNSYLGSILDCLKKSK